MGPAGEQMGDGIADHRRFVPCRDQHGRRRVERAVAQCGTFAHQGLGPAGEPQPQPQRIDRKIVSRADQEKDPREQQQLMLEQGEPLPQAKISDGQGDPFPCVSPQTIAALPRMQRARIF
jgi:hypothetical protein